MNLAKAATAGDAIALQVWEEIGTEIGSALSSVIWILNPDTIVIGGGIARAGELIFAPIERAVRQRTIRFFNEKLRIVPAQLGNDAGIIGSATLALETLPR
ncbi:MAG: ROK family protein [Verrucomicrobiaceae bacterium]|nr:MAG: ROK family protein [Verrucomicrobiaceae bacterium]